MPDISMCWGKDCPLKEECYRYLAKPSERQAYLCTPPYNAVEGCQLFSQASPWEKLNARQ